MIHHTMQLLVPRCQGRSGSGSRQICLKVHGWTLYLSDELLYYVLYIKGNVMPQALTRLSGKPQTSLQGGEALRDALNIEC